VNYVAETWRILTYLAGPFALVFALAAGLSILVNKVSRERVLNPWLWGGLAMVCLAIASVVYHFIWLHRSRGAEVP
jgi:predicted membrane channel-forming protein YqfA (hemolysin III family)